MKEAAHTSLKPTPTFLLQISTGKDQKKELTWRWEQYFGRAGVLHDTPSAPIAPAGADAAAQRVPTVVMCALLEPCAGEPPPGCTLTASALLF